MCISILVLLFSVYQSIALIRPNFSVVIIFKKNVMKILTIMKKSLIRSFLRS